MPEFYKIGEIAKILRVSRPTLDKLLASGEVPSVHFGKTRRIPKKQFDLYLKDKLDDATGEVQNRKVLTLARLNR